MNCLVLPVSLIRRRSTRYHPLTKDDDHQDLDKELESHNAVTVVVGREKRVFFVDPFILQENPFRVLMDQTSMKMDQGDKEDHHHLGFSTKQHGVVFVDVDVILFEHMLWLVQNDYSSLCNLNLKEIIDFYAQDI